VFSQQSAGIAALTSMTTSSTDRIDKTDGAHQDRKAILIRMKKPNSDFNKI